MTMRIVLSVLIATLLTGVSTSAQSPGGQAALAGRFVDPANGLSLEQAIARAIEQEPSLRAARSQVEVAQGTKLQASVRPNPSVSFERRQEPGGTDHLTTVGVEWPLDLFRRSERLAVAGHEVTVAQLSASDRERLLTAEVRARYGDALATIRELGLLDEIVAATQNQFDLLRSRVEQGASPPLERDLVDVELQRVQADRLLQVGRTETAVFELKRVLGMKADAPLTVRDTFEALVQRESALASEVVNASMAVEQRGDVRAAAARIETAVAKIDRAESEGHVDLSLFGNYMRMDSGFPQRGFAPNGGLERVRGQFNYWSAGAMVTIPILNRNQGNVAVARAEQTGAAAAYDAARLAAEAEVSSARARDERAREAVKIYGGGAQALARQNLAVVGQSYELGRVTVFEVLAERRRYLDVERAYTEALRAAYEARTALKRALGEGR
ncbi:MAG TPA: TolC family protein [Vicinamibacterales bacterium]|nr:TolC family protein [Vicinamibacterales bacterium]